MLLNVIILSPFCLLPACSQFIGREEELDQITTYLSDPACRLLTLTGHGGSGKTRLAIAAAQQLSAAFRHGVCYVSLTAVDDVTQIAPAILEGLGVPLADRVKPDAQLQTYLQERELPLAEQSEDQEITATILNALGIIARDRGDFGKAEALFRQALARVDASSGKYAWWQQGSFHVQLGIGYLRQEAFAAAKACFQRGRRAFAQVESDLGENVVLRNLGNLALQQGDFTAARENYEDALATTERLGSQVYQAQVLVQLGRLAIQSGDLAQAETWLQQADQIGEALGASFIVDDVTKLRGSLQKKARH